MEFIIDSVNLEEIKDAFKYLPVVGITSNPSIIAKELSQHNRDTLGNVSLELFYEHMKKIVKTLEDNASLHIQTIATNAIDMVREAHYIKKHIYTYAYIKIPATKEGLKAIKILKEYDKDFRITATAVYDVSQALYATALNVDYIAPYVNRIIKIDEDPYKLITDTVKVINKYGYKTKILAASFKDQNQIIKAINAGAQAITAPHNLLLEVFNNDSIDKAVQDFTNDWENTFGTDSGIYDDDK